METLITSPTLPHRPLQPVETAGVADVPFTAECEILPEGETFDSDQLFKDCPKKSGHPFYIPVKNFTIEHLPRECRTHNFMREIQIISALTVKVMVFYTSLNRPNTFVGSSKPYPYKDLKGSSSKIRCGTGYIFYDSIQSPLERGCCPCDKCKYSGSPKSSYLRVIVGTATHVVYDHSEAVQTVCQCFYDSDEDKEGVKLLQGVDAKIVNGSHRCHTDYCEIICVTHDKELIRKLRELTLMDRFHYNRCGMSSCSQGVMISHPHGRSKHISIGKILDGWVLKDSQVPTNSPLNFGPDTKCRIPSLPSSSSSLPSPDSITNTNVSLEGNTTLTDGDIPLQTFSSNSISINTDDEEEVEVIDKRTSPHNAPCENSTSNSHGGFFRRMLQKCKSVLSSSSATPAQPGNGSTPPAYKDYPVPVGMSFTLPIDSPELGYFHHPLNDRHVWMRFPKNTKFFSSDGQQIPIPQKAMFQWPELDKHVSKCLHFITYDIVTCNGCSGAPILACSSKYLGLFLFHAGAMKEEKNRSGLTPVFGLMPQTI